MRRYLSKHGPALAAEGMGTALFLLVIVGSGVTVDRLGGDAAGALFVHAVAVGGGLGVLIALFAAASGAHFNPAVTLALWRAGLHDRQLVLPYVAAQVAGGVVGVLLTHVTFETTLVSVSGVDRSGLGRPLAELVATFVLAGLIVMLVRRGRTTEIPVAVAVWVTTIVVATSSTGFANPAVTVARSLTDTYSGIAPVWVPGFVFAQLAGAGLAVLVFDRLAPSPRSLREQT